MIFPRMIQSLLDTDLYKFNMGQCIYSQFPDFMMTWTFKCRNENVHFTGEMVQEIKEQVQAFCDLRFNDDEIKYLELNYPWLKAGYLNFLRMWRPRFDDIEITDDAPCGLAIEAKGSWLNTTMYEVPILAIVNEVYFRMEYDYDKLIKSFNDKLVEKIRRLDDNEIIIGQFSEFGTRRRLSYEAQLEAIKMFYYSKHFKKTSESCIVGTSNVHIAKLMNDFGIYDLAKGTIAHEFIMAMQGMKQYNVAYGNRFALDAWVKEYKTMNGIALTDTLGTDVFLRDFDITYATLFSGVRQDSGDPYEWGEKIIKKYESFGIDPKTKTLLFSDSLDFDRAAEIYKYFADRCHVAFGIGTYIANDTCVEPLNIVMKATMCNGGPVAKISDTPGKGMCKDDEYVDYLKRSVEWRLTHKD